MTIHVLQDVELWFDIYRLRGQMNSLALSDSIELHNTPVLGDTAQRRTPGLRDVACDIEGYWASTEDAALQSKVGVADVPVTAAPVGSTEGARAYLFRALAGEYSPGAGVGEPFAFSFNAQGSAGERLVRGSILHNAVRTADGQNTGLQLGAIGAAQKIYAALHVLSFSSANPTVIYLESDDNAGFLTPTVRITFDTLTAAASQWKSLAGAVTDGWWRVRWDVPVGTPSIQFVLAAGIQ